MALHHTRKNGTKKIIRDIEIRRFLGWLDQRKCAYAVKKRFTGIDASSNVATFGLKVVKNEPLGVNVAPISVTSRKTPSQRVQLSILTHDGLENGRFRQILKVNWKSEISYKVAVSMIDMS